MDGYNPLTLNFLLRVRISLMAVADESELIELIYFKYQTIFLKGPKLLEGFTIFVESFQLCYVIRLLQNIVTLSVRF